jgi:hypothetical protein
MKKQNRTTLIRLGLMIALTLGVAAVSARAQSYDHITANIPFEFTVGGKQLPAGTYTVRQLSPGTPYLFSLRGRDTQAIASGFTNAIQANTTAAQTKLVFHKYGEQYFLSEVWIDGEDTGHQFLKSRAERELKREMARNFSRPEMAAIVAAGQF